MTSGVYPRKPGLWAGNGGKRRRTTPPKLNRTEAEHIRALRAAGTLVKQIAWLYKVSRGLIYCVLNQQGAYATTSKETTP